VSDHLIFTLSTQSEICPFRSGLALFLFCGRGAENSDRTAQAATENHPGPKRHGDLRKSARFSVTGRRVSDSKLRTMCFRPLVRKHSTGCWADSCLHFYVKLESF
jgi:hypothetical protein